ncbi:MAG: hypothetical protein K0R62_5027 [Nonomuraea muscovyensis]|nr:hypothetical protein [Nonomuraea muscovyensis]
MVGDVTGGADVVDRDVVGRAAVDALAQQDEGRVVRTGGSRLPPVCSMITSQPTSAAASMMNRDSSAK